MRKNTLSPNHQHLCALLREVRREVGFTQAELAAHIKRDQTFVSKYETGERMLDVLELREICKALGVPMEKFIRRLGEKTFKVLIQSFFGSLEDISRSFFMDFGMFEKIRLTESLINRKLRKKLIAI